MIVKLFIKYIIYNKYYQQTLQDKVKAETEIRAQSSFY